MLYRLAHPADIPALTEVRLAVRENVLRNHALVTEADYRAYLTQRGRGWVAETAGRVVGFAIADAQQHSIWALFVHPNFDKQGIGKTLHRLLLNWYFAQTDHTIWLTTSPGTRAEEFYHRQGWQATGRTSSGEVRFELTKERWNEKSAVEVPASNVDE
ncbi:GNAT family N-acetyltransferase [Hymenobacter sp. UYP22]|uniref:GNAT family N-acetyltransferase n=1 Tax=Hymenobacter sp. UYP22 TaxID=3156348 RepID=UPI00339358D2